ncbi:MAG: (E)-4-hydroxy-3-methylbut-2-enyl-diphosphate synthase [Acidobacteriota bacterium]
MSDRPSILLPHARRRRPTRRVLVGDVGIGGDEPIRVQSMTTTLTGDTEATAQQAFALEQVGCEIVRVTVPNLSDAASLPALRKRLEELGARAPLVADIHFNPKAAMEAADTCEKVRINPGNFADGKRFAVREYSDAEYAAELDRIRDRFLPLVEKCKRLGRAMRIGTNHGSLSDRIMNRFGDTPLGMVESALEFLRICRDADYHDIVLSMKASNPFVAVEAYRLLALRMELEDFDHPFHLGVTEAGDGEDGRIKSAIGIGSLLADGLGDTIRVSLTEDPRAEIPVAQALAAPWTAAPAEPNEPSLAIAVSDHRPAPGEGWKRRDSCECRVGESSLGGEQVPQVWLDLNACQAPPADPQDREADAWLLDVRADEPDAAALRDLIDRSDRPALAMNVGSEQSELLALALQADVVLVTPQGETQAQWQDSLLAAAASVRGAGRSLGLRVDANHLDPTSLGLAPAEALGRSAAMAARVAAEVTGSAPLLCIDAAPGDSPVHAWRIASSLLAEEPALPCPLLLADGSHDPKADLDAPLLTASEQLGGLLVDGIGDAIVLTGAEPSAALTTAFGILQATRLRMSRPDYISCPSCGRTLFELEETTQRIRNVTSHLVGVKIAIMGCIVNGPGEMADADFGYVGSAPGKVNLYVKKDCVEKGIPSERAPERLVQLIKDHGRWIEPEPETVAVAE